MPKRLAKNERAAHNGQVINEETSLVMRDMAFNSAEFRRKLYRMFLDRRRNIEKECGYPDTEDLDAERYKQLYDREPLAAKVVDLFPKGCWQTPPQLFETEDIDEETPFEQAWKELNKTIRGQGFYEEEGDSGNAVWEYLERADRLSGVGHYGAILLGVDDGKEMSEPLDLAEPKQSKRDSIEEVEPKLLEEPKDQQNALHNPEEDLAEEQAEKKSFVGKQEQSKTRKLLFMRPLDETMCEIVAYDTDTESARFGMPIMYSVTIESSGYQSVRSRVLSTQTKRVHWTRIVHLADNLESSEVFGAPRMRVLYNRLYDLYKVYGGSAEMYWLAAFFGISFETHPQLGGDVTINKADMREQIENFQNTLSRFLAMPGMTAKTLAPQVSDPTQQIDAQIQAICIYLEVPNRIFMGSERGELSSSQDARAWYAVLGHRRTSYVTPRVIVPFVDRLIQIGILPEPESYRVKWADIATLTEAERAEVANKQTEAMTKYISGGVEAIMDPLDFFVRVIGFSDDEAITIIDNRMTTDMATEEEIPMLDEEGQPMFDEFGMPMMETVKAEIGQDRELGGKPKKDEFGRPVAVPELDEDGNPIDEDGNVIEEGDENEPTKAGKKGKEPGFATKKKKSVKKKAGEEEQEPKTGSGNAPKKKKKRKPVGKQQ